jgi:hypothetical protein
MKASSIKKGSVFSGFETSVQNRKWVIQSRRNSPPTISSKSPVQVARAEVHPYSGFDTLSQRDITQFCDFTDQFLRKRISASSNISDMVINAVLNQFLALPDPFKEHSSVEPKKYSYTSKERKYNTAQLNEYLTKIPSLEVITSKGDLSLGNFDKKDRYQFTDRLQLIHSELWTTQTEYHLVFWSYLDNIEIDRDRVEESIEREVNNKYGEELLKIEKVTAKLEDDNFQSLLEKVEKYAIDKDISVPEIFGGSEMEEGIKGHYAMIMYLTNTGERPELVKILKQSLDLLETVRSEVKERLDSLPSYEGIIPHLLSKVATNSIIIYESERELNLPEVKLISHDSYNMRVYQKT